MKKKDKNKKVDIRTNPNTGIIAYTNKGGYGFDIFLDISGKQEYIMSHRHNAFLFELMRNRISLSELRRWEPKPARNNLNRKNIRKKRSSVSHIIRVIDDYIKEELTYVPCEHNEIESALQ